jgi:hypothetical protein
MSIQQYNLWGNLIRWDFPINDGHAANRRRMKKMDLKISIHRFSSMLRCQLWSEQYQEFGSYLESLSSNLALESLFQPWHSMDTYISINSFLLNIYIYIKFDERSDTTWIIFFEDCFHLLITKMFADWICKQYIHTNGMNNLMFPLTFLAFNFFRRVLCRILHLHYFVENARSISNWRFAHECLKAVLKQRRSWITVLHVSCSLMKPSICEWRCCMRSRRCCSSSSTSSLYIPHYSSSALPLCHESWNVMFYFQLIALQIRSYKNCVVYWESGLWYRPNWMHIESGENPRGVGFPEGRVQGDNGGQRESVYEQPKIEVDDSCHSWREPSK